MLPAIPILLCCTAASSSLLRYRFALGSYGCGCFISIIIIFLFAFASGAAFTAIPALAAIAAGIAGRIAITGSYIISVNISVLISVGVKAKQHVNAEADGGE